MKAAYRDQVERLYRGGVDIVGKEHFTSLYSPAREKALTKRNITAGWAATGLFPFNPERVLRDTPKPPVTLPKADKVVGSCLQDEALQTPKTPTTPATAEALTSLHNLIKQDVCVLDEISKQRLQRHVQKLASATRISFAECALLQDQNQFLSKINSETKVRRSTRSVVLGKAKVMSYEDLNEARAKRSAKEKATAGKGKRSRKRKSPASEAGVLEPKTKVVRMSEAEPARALVAQMSEVPEPWRAPVARMY